MRGMIVGKQALPVALLGQLLGPETQADAAAQVETRKIKQIVGQLFSRPVIGYLPALNDVETALTAIGMLGLDMGAKPGQDRGHGRNTACQTFQRRVTPGFIVAREETKMTATHKMVVIHAEERAGGADKIRMIDHLDGTVGLIGQIEPPQLVQYLITFLIKQIVRYHHWQPGRAPT